MSEDPWKPASEPPHAYHHTDGYRKESDPVIGWIRGARGFGYMAIVTYIEDDEDPPEWRTTCTEEWNVTNRVTYWTELPEPPGSN